MKRKSAEAFTLLEALLALMVCSLTSLLAVGCLQSMLAVSSIRLDHQNQFGIIQARMVLALAQNVRLEQEQVVFIQSGKQFSFSIKKERLVKEPGYEIYMAGIKNASFIQEGGKIYLLLDQEKIQLY